MTAARRSTISTPAAAPAARISALPATPTWCRPAPPRAWSFDPFAGTVREGALCGRGAVDMKGAIAAFIAAAERFLERAARDFTGSISLLITGDEEGAAINGTRKVLEWLEQRGETLDACLVGEPTSATALGDMIKIGRRGSMTGRLDGARRAGSYRLPASRRQRGASPGRDAACADRERARPRLRAFSAVEPAGLDDRHRQPRLQCDPGDRTGRLQHPVQRSLDQRRTEKMAD